MSIDRYLRRSVLRPFAAILGVLVALFAAYSLSGILADAVGGLLPVDVIVALAGLKLLIALEVLTPISLFVAVVVAFGRLQEGGELTMMLALGMSPVRLARPVVLLALVFAVFVSGLSLFARPWAYGQSHAITRHASDMLNLNAMKAATFYASHDGAQVIFLGSRDDPHGPAQGVFVARREDNGKVEVIYANSAWPAVTDTSGRRRVLLSGAHVYDLDTQNPANDRVVEAESVSVNPDSVAPAAPGYSPVAARSLWLAASHYPADIAELQWRLSTGLSTLLLALLGMSLSWGRPRQSRYAKFGPAILAYSAYYLLCTIARTWVEHGRVGPFPGLWWAPAGLILVLVAIWTLRSMQPRPAAGRRLPLGPLRTADLASGPKR